MELRRFLSPLTYAKELFLGRVGQEHRAEAEAYWRLVYPYEEHLAPAKLGTAAVLGLALLYAVPLHVVDCIAGFLVAWWWYRPAHAQLLQQQRVIEAAQTAFAPARKEAVQQAKTEWVAAAKTWCRSLVQKVTGLLSAKRDDSKEAEA